MTELASDDVVQEPQLVAMPSFQSPEFLASAVSTWHSILQVYQNNASITTTHKQCRIPNYLLNHNKKKHNCKLYIYEGTLSIHLISNRPGPRIGHSNRVARQTSKLLSSIGRWLNRSKRRKIRRGSSGNTNSHSTSWG